ncbi:hypothetical protein SAMN04515674_107206 [Pseudarcicella hirudinis]|uniref:DUF5777 domain-containing protein n=1 Tax=Pseudarcicella hirudinis TaxID=1079859 RepID=A0A1I5UJ51_9BACT|nr:DUF5777 family beta-barrel protein [Pseudarcicella hirudinis]SFP95067.1 hypothetical protein SAMN04515674_107206 [Pseudarcicella hirudinis]
MKKILYILMLFLISGRIVAQTDLLNMIPKDTVPVYVTSTFKATRIINGQSVETTPSHHLDYRISHRFGTLNSGSYQFFGLDQGYIYMGFDYGINKDWMVGVGRSSEQKMINLYSKLRVLRQRKEGMPISLTLMGEGFADMLNYPESDQRTTLSKYSYLAQVLIARRFNDRLSLQFMPTFLYRNRNNVHGENNGVTALGIAGRYKLTKRTAFVAEYYAVLPNQIDKKYNNSLSFGFDIETGGHVFSLHLTNSIGMVEKQFLAETTGSWGNGDIHFGFNLGRSFGLGKKYRTNYKVQD